MNPQIRSNQSEGTMLVKCQNWQQFKRLMAAMGREAIDWTPGNARLSIRFSSRKYKKSVDWVLRACR